MGATRAKRRRRTSFRVCVRCAQAVPTDRGAHHCQHGGNCAPRLGGLAADTPVCLRCLAMRSDADWSDRLRRLREVTKQLGDASEGGGCGTH